MAHAKAWAQPPRLHGPAQKGAAMFRSSRSLTCQLTGLSALVLTAPAQAQVTIACDPPVATSRAPCVLTAAHADARPRTWRWGVVGLADAAELLEPIAPDRVRVKTPVTLVERAFTVVAEDSQNPSVTGTFVLRITPNPQAGSGERALVEGIFPGAFTPSLLPFPGPEPAMVNRIAFCDDEAMGALDRRGNVYVCQRWDGIRKIGLDGRVVPFGLKDGEREGPVVRPVECLTVDPSTGDLYVGEFDRLVKLAPDGKPTEVIGGGGQALASSHGSELAPLNPGRVPRGTRFKLGSRQLALRGREAILVGWKGIDAFHLDSRRLERIVAFQPHLLANRLGPIPYLNPHLGAGRCAAVQGCGPLALTKEALCLVGMGPEVAELELPDDPLTTVMDPPQAEGKAAGGAPELDNLWPGPAVETAMVRAGGSWGASHWRSAAPGQRFTGQCRVAARNFTAGVARIGLMFADPHGSTLVDRQPTGPRGQDGVGAPAHGETLLSMTGTAPAGTDRVALCLQVAGGNPGAEVTFREMTLHQLP